MRELTTFEISNISGAESESVHTALEGLVVGVPVGMMQRLLFVTGTAMAGMAAGHIGGTVIGYQWATRAGASTANCCLSALGLGAVGAAVGGVASVSLGALGVSKFYD